MSGLARPPADPDAFAEAVAWHRDRLILTDDEFDGMEDDAVDQAFMVAGVAQLDLVMDVWDRLDRALAQGEDLDTFKAALEERLTAAWGRDDPSRIEQIFRTNVQMAYAAGRYEQMTEPAVKDARPFWRYSAIYDKRTCPICSPCDGVVLPVDHPWWSNHYPILHWNCRCHAVTMSADEADGLVTPDPPDVDPAEGFGEPPVVGSWEPDLDDVPQPLRAAYGG